MANRQQQRRGTAAAWTAANPVLAQGEIGLETDTAKLKIGDGAAAWATLAYFASGGGGSGYSNIVKINTVQDLTFINDAVATAGSAIITSASNGFATASAGQVFWMTGAGVSNVAILDTTIASKQSSGQITVATVAGTSAGARRAAFGTDNHVAIEAAISVDSHIWIPKNSLWVVSNDTTPARCTIEGEDWETTVLKSRNVNLPYLLALGASSVYLNVAFFDSFSTYMPMVWPDGLAAPRPSRYLMNADTDHTYPPQCYAWQPITMTIGSQVTPGKDRGGLTVTNFGIGGAYYGQIYSDQAPAFHADLNENRPTDAGRGLLVYNHGAGHAIELQGWSTSTGDLAYIQPLANVKSINIVPSVATTNDVTFTTTTKTTGQIFYLQHSGSTFSGHVIQANMAAGSGLFWGNFLTFQVNGVNVFQVDFAGAIQATASQKAGIPTVADIPSGKWMMTKDVTNNTLKIYSNDNGVIKSVALA